jgi:hypothetical protein
MSLLLSPLILFLLGAIVARLSKSRRIWRRHSLFTVRICGILLALYTVFMVALLVDTGYFAALMRILPGESGTDWVLNSGILHLDPSWPLAERAVVAWVILGFMLFPLWMYLGVMTSYWLFGRNPRQRGIIGLLL